MPSFVDRYVGSSKRVRLYADPRQRQEHGRDRTPIACELPPFRGATDRATSAAGTARSGTSSTSSARVSAASPHDPPTINAFQMFGCVGGGTAYSNADDDERGERLGHDQPVVHPEVRVDRGDAGGDPPGAVPRQPARQEPDEHDGHGPEHGHREPLRDQRLARHERHRREHDDRERRSGQRPGPCRRGSPAAQRLGSNGSRKPSPRARRLASACRRAGRRGSAGSSSRNAT